LKARSAICYLFDGRAGNISHRGVLDLSGFIVPKTEHRWRLRDATDAAGKRERRIAIDASDYRNYSLAD
jgi:hypothetical protein